MGTHPFLAFSQGEAENKEPGLRARNAFGFPGTTLPNVVTVFGSLIANDR